METFWDIFEPSSWSLLWLCWSNFEAILAQLASSWGYPRTLFGPAWDYLGLLGPSWAIWGVSWDQELGHVQPGRLLILGSHTLARSFLISVARVFLGHAQPGRPLVLGSLTLVQSCLISVIHGHVARLFIGHAQPGRPLILGCARAR